jgi:hypothetical protein
MLQLRLPSEQHAPCQPDTGSVQPWRRLSEAHAPPPLHSAQVLLLDEVTVDMDVLGRLDLLDFFKQVCYVQRLQV